MGRIVLRRSLLALVQLFGASIIIFVLVRQLPGDPAVAQLGSTAGPEQVAALRDRLGLDEPVPVQYVIWLGDVLQGELGRSTVTGNAVTEDLRDRTPATLELITIAIALSLIILVPLGIITARRARSLPGRAIGRATHTYGMFAGSLPDFWLAQILVFVFFFKLAWAPAPLGRISLNTDPPRHITGFYTLDSLVTGNWAAFSSAVAHLALPVITLVFVYGAPLLKMTRSTVSHNLESEFVQQARAAGIDERTQLRMSFRNTLPPIITLAGITYGFVIGGAVLVETIFSWGGLGQYSVLAISNADFNAIQGFVLLATVFSIFIYLMVDLIHYWVDPRIRT